MVICNPRRTVADKERCPGTVVEISHCHGQISQFGLGSGTAVVATAPITVDRNKMVRRLTRAQSGLQRGNRVPPAADALRTSTKRIRFSTQRYRGLLGTAQ